MNSNSNYYLYYQIDDEYMVLSNTSKIIKQLPYEKFKLLKHTFYMTGNYEGTKEDLIRYSIDFNRWTTDLRNYEIVGYAYYSYFLRKVIHYLDVTYFYNFNVMAREFFKSICEEKYDHHTQETKTELSYSNDCYNGGLLYCSDDIKYEYTQSHAYDLNMAYGEAMASDALMIPNKEGKEYKLVELPNLYKIPVGYYRVKIECENDDFKKLFSFSKNHTYTDRSLYQALKYQKQYDIKIELNQDLLYNAYLYNDNDLDKGSDIFIKWFDIVKDLKQKFPDNQIIKFIASSTHGQIEAKYIIYKTQQ